MASKSAKSAERFAAAEKASRDSADWVRRAATAIAAKDRPALAAALKNRSARMTSSKVRLNLPSSLSAEPVSLLGLARLLSSAECARELATLWTASEPDAAMSELMESMDAFEAGEAEAEATMRAIWHGMRDCLESAAVSKYCGAAVSCRAPMATRSLLEYASLHPFTGAGRLAPSAQAFYALMPCVERAIALGDSAKLRVGLRDIVALRAGHRSSDRHLQTIAAFAIFAIACERPQFVETLLGAISEIVKAPELTSLGVMMVARAVEPIFAAATPAGRAGVEGAFASAFGEALASDVPAAQLKDVRKRCRAELSELLPCMLDGVQAADAAMQRGELLAAISIPPSVSKRRAASATRV